MAIPPQFQKKGPNAAGRAEDRKDKGVDNANESPSGNPFTKKPAKKGFTVPSAQNKMSQQVPPQAQAIMDKIAQLKQGQTGGV